MRIMYREAIILVVWNGRRMPVCGGCNEEIGWAYDEIIADVGKLKGDKLSSVDEITVEYLKICGECGRMVGGNV